MEEEKVEGVDMENLNLEILKEKVEELDLENLNLEIDFKNFFKILKI